MGKHTRTYARHWGTYYDGPAHPPPGPRWPWLRDGIIAGIVGVLIGGSIGFALVRGYWPFAGSLGVALLVVHLVIVGLGQVVDATRLARADLLRISAVGWSAIGLAALALLVLAR